MFYLTRVIYRYFVFVWLELILSLFTYDIQNYCLLCCCLATVVFCSELGEHMVTDVEMLVRVQLLPIRREYSLMV